MRLRHLIPALLVLAVIAGGAVTVHAAADRQRSFAQGAAALRVEWHRDEALGVPAASLAPLRARLAAGQPASSWWSPKWLQDDGSALLDRLGAQTQSAWTLAMTGQRAQAQATMAQWTAFAAQNGPWLSATSVAAAAGWPAQLSAAASPATLAVMATTWSGFLAQQRTAVAAARQAQLATQLRLAGGSAGVLAAAHRLVSQADAASLETGTVAILAAQLTTELASNDTGVPATHAQLLTATAALQALITLNSQVGAQVLPLLWDVDQARAEGAGNAAALGGQETAIAAQYRAARTGAQLTAVAQAIAALRGQVSNQLAASQCGHAVGGGKVITLSLSLQEMVFYQDGCVVRATPVSTGRPQLRTPTGTFAIFYKKTPFTFISPWPPSSPFYYYPSPVSWVMEFAAGGYFIHDAPWEPLGDYGPGSENNPAAASHGCVHTPGTVMQWAFSWTPVGTPVVISA